MQTNPERQTDVQISDHGSIVIFTPLTVTAQDWVDHNVAVESWQWMGKGFAVEHRYADGLISLMQDDGLIVDC